MICILEIAMTIWGIVTLAKGEIKLSRNKVVRGASAYLAGILLACTTPLAAGSAFAIGVYIGMTQPNAPADNFPFFVCDLGAILFCGGGAALIALLAPNASAPRVAPGSGFYAPQDPNNPYSPPSDGPPPRK